MEILVTSSNNFRRAERPGEATRKRLLQEMTLAGFFLKLLKNLE